MKKSITMAFLLLAGVVSAQSNLGDVVGTVLSSDESKEPIVGAKPYIDAGDARYYAVTDIDGRFRISAIPAGTYSLNIIYFGDTMSNIKVDVPIDGYANIGEIRFKSGFLTVAVINVVSEDGSMKLDYSDVPAPEMTAKEIRQSAVRTDVSKLISSMTTDVKRTDDGELVFRGARKGDMIYYMDGVKTNELNPVPSASIGRIKVYSGGLPAKYGDTLGGVVVMESLSYFDLYRAWYGEQVKSGKIK